MVRDHLLLYNNKKKRLEGVHHEMNQFTYQRRLDKYDFSYISRGLKMGQDNASKHLQLKRIDAKHVLKSVESAGT